MSRAFIENSRIRQLTFTPYSLAFWNHLQGLTYLVVNITVEKFEFLQEKYTRELIMMQDGAQLAISWHNGPPQPSDKRPILVIFPGLAGDEKVLYIRTIVRRMQKDFKCVVVNWRGMGGGDLGPSTKLFNMVAWNDYKEAIDHIHLKHCKTDLDSARPLYLSAVSLGAIVATWYLMNNPDSPVKAAAIYGTLFDAEKSGLYFENSFFGIYNRVLGG